MNPRRIFLLVLAGLLAAMALLFLVTRKTITLEIDGEARPLVTHALTVAGALRQAEVALLPEDRVDPEPETFLPPGSVVRVERARLVQVRADGTALELRTRLRSPLAILAALGLEVAPADAVWVDGYPLGAAPPAGLAPPLEIVVRRPMAVTVVDDGTSALIRSAARTVGEALWGTGYVLHQADRLEPAGETPLRAGMTITLRRARPVTFLTDGISLPRRTQAETVGAALGEAGLALTGLDYSLPAEDQPLPPDGVMRVVRVRESILTAQEVLPAETVYQALPDREIDTLLTLQAGAAGLKQRWLRVRHEDGVEVSRVDEGEQLVQAPEPRVIGYGSQIVVRSLATPEGAIEYWRAFDMYATSYSPSRAGVPATARNFGITASGRPLVKGLVAIDRRLIPFGSRMYVPGYGFAEAADTGGGVKGRWIDLGYDDWNYVSWHQTVTVYFLTPVPPADRITWIIPSTVP